MAVKLNVNRSSAHMSRVRRAAPERQRRPTIRNLKKNNGGPLQRVRPICLRGSKGETLWFDRSHTIIQCFFMVCDRVWYGDLENQRRTYLVSINCEKSVKESAEHEKKIGQGSS